MGDYESGYERRLPDPVKRLTSDQVGLGGLYDCSRKSVGISQRLVVELC